MKSFDDYRKELTMPQLLVSANCCRHAFEAGQQSKQAEIDELQKRIDEAMRYVSESPLKDVSRRAMLNFLDILKGNQND